MRRLVLTPLSLPHFDHHFVTVFLVLIILQAMLTGANIFI